MPGVIALLPEPFAARVESLWDSMERDFGIPRGYVGAVPHMTYHIGSHDTDKAAEAVVARIASETAPLTVFTSGLGVFAGSPAVLHVMVARSPALSALAERLDSALGEAGFPSTDAYFAPEKWIPHITLAHRNLDGIALGPVLGWLVQQQLAWEIPLSSISIARETERGADVLATFPLSG